MNASNGSSRSALSSSTLALKFMQRANIAPSPPPPVASSSKESGTQASSSPAVTSVGFSYFIPSGGRIRTFNGLAVESKPTETESGQKDKTNGEDEKMEDSDAGKNSSDESIAGEEILVKNVYVKGRLVKPGSTPSVPKVEVVTSIRSQKKAEKNKKKEAASTGESREKAKDSPIKSTKSSKKRTSSEVSDGPSSKRKNGFRRK